MTSRNQMTRRDNAPPPVVFRHRVEADARAQLVEVLGSKKGKEASVRVGLAFAATARTARDPQALYNCSRESVASAIAMSALTELMPGGPAPAVWLVPKGGELQWWLSHRGIAALCLRAGYQVMPVPVHVNDHVLIEFGEVVEHEPADWPERLQDILGVYVTVRKLEDALVLCRPWVPRRAIEKRKEAAATARVWNAWPVEMAQKTAIKWTLSRGLLPLQSVELNMAMGAEPEPPRGHAPAPAPAPAAEAAPSPPPAPPAPEPAAARDALGIPVGPPADAPKPETVGQAIGTQPIPDPQEPADEPPQAPKPPTRGELKTAIQKELDRLGEAAHPWLAKKRGERADEPVAAWMQSNQTLQGWLEELRGIETPAPAASDPNHAKAVERCRAAEEGLHDDVIALVREANGIPKYGNLSKESLDTLLPYLLELQQEAKRAQGGEE